MDNRHPTSFLNERSLEYFLVPELVGKLAPFCKSAVPLFFWKTREGGKMSSLVHGTKSIKLAALFARRPKLLSGHYEIYGKINHQILKFARAAYGLGVPTIAGFCAARSLFEMASDNIFWIPLEGHNPTEDIIFTTSQQGTLLTPGITIDPIRSASLAGYLLNSSTEMSFGHAIEVMSILRRELSSHKSYMSFLQSPYKPVYIAIEN